MFNSLSDRLNDTFDRLRGKGKLTEADITSAMRDIRMALLEADVNFKVVRTSLPKTWSAASRPRSWIRSHRGAERCSIVLDELVEPLGLPRASSCSRRIPNVIMLVGLQGSGKTTAAVKLAYLLKKQGKSPLLAACDVYRPAGTSTSSHAGGDRRAGVSRRRRPSHRDRPGRGARGRRQDARRGDRRHRRAACADRRADDAGRAVDIKKTVKPDQVLMVVDAMTGQDIVNVVSTFAERTDFDGVIISKLDGDARGGGALSVRAVTGKPIKFVSMGEKPDSLEVFSPDRMAKRILGMGDVVGIIEKAQEAANAEQLEAAERMLRDGFTMNDMLEQMRMLKKMGGMKSILGMLPGGQRMLNQMGGNIDDSVFDKIEAMIQSMTKQERVKPSIINGQRRARIARGSGTTPADVNNLMKQWGEMNKMMGKMRTMAQQAQGGKKGKKGKRGKKMRMPGIPGMGNMGALGGMGGNPFAGMGGSSGNADMDMFRAMEQQMKGKKF